MGSFQKSSLVVGRSSFIIGQAAWSNATLEQRAASPVWPPPASLQALRVWLRAQLPPREQSLREQSFQPEDGRAGLCPCDRCGVDLASCDEAQSHSLCIS